MMYLPDIVTGGRLRLAEGGIVDISVAETLEVKRNLWLGSSKLNLVWAPVKGRQEKKRYGWQNNFSFVLNFKKPF